MMNRFRASVSLVAAGFLSIIAPSTDAQEQRQWTSKDGAATLEAKFHRIQNDEVTLILPNGRSQVLKRELLSDADLAWIEEFQKAASAAGKAAEGASPTAVIPKALKGNLVDAKGRSASLGDEGAAIPKYYLFYYSASWCAPCTAFTPDLIRDYKRAKTQIPELEIILVPSDQSAEAAAAYMKDYRMPWLGLKFNPAGTRGVPGNPGDSIPALRLTDANGMDILTSKEVPRDRFVTEAVKRIQASTEG